MSRLARHELPSRVLFLPELPKNHAGKVEKYRLRDLLGQPEEERT